MHSSRDRLRLWKTNYCFTVISYQPTVTTMNDAPLPPSLRRIRWIAHWVRAMALFAMVVVIGFPLVFWSQPAWAERAIREDLNLTGALQFDVASRIGALAANLPLTLLTFYALLSLWRLFGGYLRGEVFSDAATRHLRRMGQSLVAMAVVMPLTQTATVLALTLGNPPGQRLLSFQLGTPHYVVLLCGLVLTAMALVMREAQRMAQENAEFV